MREAAPTGQSATLTCTSRPAGPAAATVGPAASAGTGGRAGATGTGGIATCNPNSPELQTDTANCGTCFHQCIVPNATPSCVAGMCQYACQPGFFDADKDPANGCECTKTNGGVEICDGLDNDCNGAIDDGFDFLGDVSNCGGCNHQCAFPFASASCVSGVCTQGACLPNFYDRDPTVPGCETECIKTNGGVEICDGLDNDCDGIVDDHLGAPTVACLTKGVCAGTQPTCSGQNGWVCNYPSTYEAIEDTKFGCDTLDNDCNGLTDEPFQIGKSCIYGTGPCAGTGTWVCDNSMAGNHRCMGSMKPPGVEICDGIDNDCDGLVDELDSASNRTTDDVLVHFASGAVDVTMFAYEASRYDADGQQQRVRLHPPALHRPRQAPLVECHHGRGRSGLRADRPQAGASAPRPNGRWLAVGSPPPRHDIPLRQQLRRRCLQRQRLPHRHGEDPRAHSRRERVGLRLGHLRRRRV